jgi:hypothetical protein
VHGDCASPTSPICSEVEDGLSECRPCASEAECFERDPNRGECLGSGECAECGTHSDCGDPEKPLCDTETRTCVACTHASIELPDAACAEDNGNNPVVCITSGEHAGKCGPCDPATHVGCPGNVPFCDTDFICKGCLDDGDCPNGGCHHYGAELDDFKECWECDGVEDCPSGKVCSSGHACVNCTSDADCAGNPAGPECVLGSCRACDPLGNAGCSGENDTCHNGLFVCVECMTGAHCPPGQGCVDFECTECATDAHCAGNAKGAQCVQVTPGNYECAACDPIGDTGCISPVAPNCDPATLTCVQ